MNIPLRIKSVRELSRTQKFSIIMGLETLWFNLKSLFTHRILLGSHGWYKVIEDINIVEDVSLIIENGEIKFIPTPSENKKVALEITQNIDD